MKRVAVFSMMSVLVMACGKDGVSGGDADGDGSGSIGTSDAGEDADGSADQGDSDDNGSDGGSDDDGEDSNDGGEDPKWDTLGIPDSPACGGPGGGGDPEFSYIWTANSTESSISKINTVTMVEEGRYLTRPDSAGSPSRTSVNLSGDVAVANRSGGVTKVFATSDKCGESNGMNGLQTSENNQFLSWNVEECRAWHTPMNYASQRPAAWTAGEWNNKSCGYEDEKLWTAGTNNSSSTIDVMLLDGEDGSIEDQVEVTGMQSSFYGIYGGAVDGDGNFWGTQLSGGKLIRVDRDDLSYQLWQTPAGGYGMTVDSEGYVWTCSSSVGRFDPQTETWQQNNVGGCAGCMADVGEDGLLWMSTCSGIIGVDRETLQVSKTCANTNGSYGISIDFEGYVWAVAYGANANRVDPETCEYETYSGLVGAYTYSDMTGFAVANAGTPSG